MNREFTPHEGYVTKDYELPDVMQADIDSGAALYVLGPAATNRNDAVVSTDKMGILGDSMVTHVPMNCIRFEVAVSENAFSYMPEDMKEHIEAGGKLYMVGIPEEGYETAMVAMDKEYSGGQMTNIRLSDLEYADEQDFTDAVANIPVNDKGLEQ